MGQTVYIDLLFLINFSMDFLCFFITARILSWKFPVVRAIFSSALGGVYSGAVLFLPELYGLSLIFDLAVCFLMCLLVWFGRTLGDILLSWIVYFAVSMALGGFMTAIFNLLNRSGLGDADAGEGDGISVWLFALIAALSGIITLLGGKFFKKKSSVRSARVEVTYGGRTAKLDALVDSGNFLREPMSARPCVVADISALRELLPREILCAAESGGVARLESASPENAKNIRLIPTRSATGDGLLLALRVEKMTIDAGKGGYEVDALLAISTLGAGESTALVPTELIK